MLNKISVLALIILTAGCVGTPPDVTSEESSDVSAGELERHTLGEAELIYLRHARGTHTIEFDEPVHGLLAHSAKPGGDVRLLDGDGRIIRDWTDLASLTDDSDPASYEGTLEFDEPATLLQFRAHGTVDFVRFEVGPGASHQHEGHDEVVDADFMLLAAISGRWIPPADVLAIANQQYLPYSGAPSSCAGTFLPGTRAIADFLRAQFVGGTSYGGYACRANTANTSQLSVHASGRAIDLFVPLDGGEADNDLGDPIAHYLIENAEALGIEFIVWDRTSWGAHRAAPKHRAYTGPHPHHDHLHIEVAPAVARNANPTIPPVDESPIGYLDDVSCDGGIRGWAHDPDQPEAPIQVYVSIGGPVFTEGAHGYWLTANNRRQDLCDAIGSCDHGYAMPIPYGLMDGQAREVYVYGEDITGGQNSELRSAPKTLQCAPPVAAFGPEYGVLRHVPNPEALDAWGFDWNGIVTVEQAELDAYPQLAPLPQAPTLTRAAGEPEVYVVEDNVRRHVTTGASFNMWGFARDEIVEQDTDALLTGEPMRVRPFLVRGAGGAVFLMTPPPPAWATNFAWNAVERVGLSQTARVGLSLTNRGSLTWQPEEFAIVGSDVELGAPVEPGQSIDVILSVQAPDVLGTTDFCFELEYLGHPFLETPPCLTIEVVEQQLPEDELVPPGAVNDSPTNPKGEDEGEPGANLVGEGSCSSAQATPAWGLILLALIALRRRR